MINLLFNYIGFFPDYFIFCNSVDLRNSSLQTHLGTGANSSSLGGAAGPRSGWLP